MSGLLKFFMVILMMTAETVQAEEPYRAAIDGDGIQRIEIVGGSYFFKPSHVIVKVNTPIELKVRKEGGAVPHDILMKAPEAGIDFQESLGTEPKTIRFTPTRTGTYPYFCSKKPPFLKSHREKGMEGKMEVVE